MLDQETVYKQCSTIIKPYVKAKLMGPLFRAPLFKALDNDLLLLKWDGKTLVAFGLLRERKRTPMLVLEKLAVLSTEHRKSHGKELLLRGLEIAKQKGLDLELSVVASNTNAVRFYEHFGLVVVGKKSIGKSGIPLLVMQRHIDKA